MDCRDFFWEPAWPDHPCGRVSERKSGCSCESESISTYSPGPIGDSERLARLIYSPVHIDVTTGKVTVAAFSDVKDKGLSVQCRAHATDAQIKTIGERTLDRDRTRGRTDREFLGIVTGRVDAIRGLGYGDDERAFCVYDSALPEIPAHGDVCQVTTSPSAMKRACKKLRDLFDRRPFLP